MAAAQGNCFGVPDFFDGYRGIFLVRFALFFHEVLHKLQDCVYVLWCCCLPFQRMCIVVLYEVLGGDTAIVDVPYLSVEVGLVAVVILVQDGIALFLCLCFQLCIQGIIRCRCHENHLLKLW